MILMRINCFLALLVAVLPAAAPAADSVASLFNDVILARGQGVEVRRGQLDDAFVAYKANLAMRGQSIPEDKRGAIEAQLLDRLIVGQLMVSRATAADKVQARGKAEKFLEEARKSAGSEEAYLRQFRVLGITPQQFTNRVVDQAVAEEVLGREVRSKVVVPPEQVQQYYETNDAAFRRPEQARASHILILTRDPRTRLELPEDQKTAKLAKAERALARAREGADFNKLIEEFSEDPLAKENKGEFQFTRAKDDPRRAMLPEFEVAAFALKPGDVSRLVKTEYGYHIIKLHEIIPARKTPFAEVGDKVRDMLVGLEAEKLLPDYFAKLKKEAGVEILDARLKEAMEQLQKESNK